MAGTLDFADDKLQSCVGSEGGFVTLPNAITASARSEVAIGDRTHGRSHFSDCGEDLADMLLTCVWLPSGILTEGITSVPPEVAFFVALRHGRGMIGRDALSGARHPPGPLVDGLASRVLMPSATP